MKEHRLRVFEDRVLRRIFGLKKDEMVGGRRMLYNKEPHDLYSSTNLIKMIKSRYRARSTHCREEVCIHNAGWKTRKKTTRKTKT
jgi:hypothetical protein